MGNKEGIATIQMLLDMLDDCINLSERAESAFEKLGDTYNVGMAEAVRHNVRIAMSEAEEYIQECE